MVVSAPNYKLVIDTLNVPQTGTICRQVVIENLLSCRDVDITVQGIDPGTFAFTSSAGSGCLHFVQVNITATNGVLSATAEDYTPSSPPPT